MATLRRNAVRTKPKSARAGPGLTWRRCPKDLYVVFVVSFLLIGLLYWGGHLGEGGWAASLFNLASGKTFGGRSKSKSPDGTSALKNVAYRGDGQADLGEYSIKVFDPVTRVTLWSSFRVEGVTACDDQSSFEGFLNSDYRCFREQVMVAIRNSGLRHLSGPELRLLEKKLVARVNRSLGKHFLKSVDIKGLVLSESTGNSGFVHIDSDEDAEP